MNEKLRAAEERFDIAFQSCLIKSANLRSAQGRITRLLSDRKDPFGSDHKAKAIQEVLDEVEKMDYEECQDEAGAALVSDAFRKVKEGLAPA